MICIILLVRRLVVKQVQQHKVNQELCCFALNFGKLGFRLYFVMDQIAGFDHQFITQSTQKFILYFRVDITTLFLFGTTLGFIILDFILFYSFFLNIF